MNRSARAPVALRVPFNQPYTSGAELEYIAEAIEGAHLSANGPFTRRCAAWLEEAFGAARVLLTHSCTGALELAALLAELGPGDEVIMPSFTFPSTATAVVLRGATPVFVDIREDTLNLDERAVERAVTERARAIVPVHYAGVACEMDALLDVAGRHGLIVIEDAAHALGSAVRGRPLGSLGALAALSFHETKSVISGEGGALIVNDPAFVDRAEIMLEKGTNRLAFRRGEVGKYSWLDVGSSFVASEVTCAFLWAQLERADWLRSERLRVWEAYHDAFAALEAAGLLRRPVIPAGSEHNAHLYYLLAPDERRRDQLMASLGAEGIATTFHYVPLHSSPAGRRFGRAEGELTVTNRASERLLRLPLWVGMSEEQTVHVVAAVHRALT